MKKFLNIAVAAIACCVLCSCSDVVISGRQRLNLVPDTQINAMSAQSYNQFLADNKQRLNTNNEQVRLVQKVGSAISKAVERYMLENGRSDEISGFDWRFNLIDSDEANAWAMPGGKVVVYTGILKYTQTEAGLAVVVAHEIAHVVAKHGAEQMSHDLLLQVGAATLEQYGASETFLRAFSIGSAYGLKLPYSRMHEYEADHLGLIFMAMAGYDPKEAPKFWQRFSQASSGNSIPEFLSTHPIDENRIQRLNSLMDEAYMYMR
jgi:predicted Zn-dependent protease